MDDIDLVRLAQQVLALVDTGRRVSTYKLATLMAIVDCCATGDVGPGDHLPLTQVSERVVTSYWNQVRPYPETLAVLRQSEQPTATVVDAVLELRAEVEARGGRAAAQAALLCPERWSEAIERVAVVLASQPLGKLQRPGGWQQGDPYPRPLYDDSVYPAKSASRTAARAGTFDVRLHPGVRSHLATLAPLLRPLLQESWARHLLTLNRVSTVETDLRRFLFGTQRISLDPVRDGLRELQQNRCFWCGATLSANPEVDHVVPWSRIPEDGLANLVAVDRACNGDKSDRPVDSSLLVLWSTRSTDELQALGNTLSWPVRTEKTRRAARAVYGGLADGHPLWAGFGSVVPLDRTSIVSALH